MFEALLCCLFIYRNIIFVCRLVTDMLSSTQLQHRLLLVHWIYNHSVHRPIEYASCNLYIKSRIRMTSYRLYKKHTNSLLHMHALHGSSVLTFKVVQGRPTTWSSGADVQLGRVGRYGICLLYTSRCV